MPQPPKILKRLSFNELIYQGSAQPEQPIKQHMLEVMKSANERLNPELDLEHILRETKTQDKPQDLLSKFVKGVEAAHSAYQLANKLDIKNIFFGRQKRLQLKVDTNKCVLRFVITDNEDHLVVSMTSAMHDNKYTVNEFENMIRKSYLGIKHLQPRHMKMMGLTMTMSFEVDNRYDIFEDLLKIFSPFI